jgi:hypothetical protein
VASYGAAFLLEEYMAGFGQNAVASTQRKMLQISLKKGGAGTPTISGSGANFCTITDNGVGDYTINLVNCPLAQTPEVLVTMVTASMRAQIGTISNTAVQILTFGYNNTTPSEADFHIQITGSLARDLL